MNPIEWLGRRSPGFAQLTPAERDEFSHFVFVWSYVEAVVFNRRTTADKIKTHAEQWEQAGAIQAGEFAEGADYFRYRYVENGEFTQHYPSLRVSPTDKPIVESVLKSEAMGDGDTVAALLLIVHRLRNNLFHGNKWEYELLGQLDNFRHANLILMRAVDCHDRARRNQHEQET
jgi:hypothetical protein